LKKYLITLTIAVVFIVAFYAFKSSTIDSNRLDVVGKMKQLSILKIKLGHESYTKLLDAIENVSKDGKITYFEYDELFEIEDMLKLEELSNKKDKK
jgi:hypothetical protein